MNWNPKKEAANSSIPAFVRSTRTERSRPSRISGAGERRSTAANAANSARLAASVTAVVPAAVWLARSTVMTSSRMAPVTVNAPATSTGRSRAAERPSAARGRYTVAAIRMSSDSSTGAKNTQRQSIAVSTPPMTSPRQNPAPEVPE